MLAKNLKSIHMRLGEKIHDLMSDYLNLLQQNKASPEKVKEMKEQMNIEMDKEYQISKNRDYSSYNPSLKF
jgi:hypothetical protein